MPFYKESLKTEHSEKLHLIFSDPILLQYTDNENTKTIKDTKNLILKYLSEIQKNQSKYWTIFHRETKNLVGFFGFYNINEKHGFASIKVIIAPKYQNKKIMHEIAPDLFLYAFNKLKLVRLEAQVYQNHFASIRLFKKLGFTQEGILRKNFLISGKHQNSILFSLLAEEWK